MKAYGIGESGTRDTYFAPAMRAYPDKLEQDIAFVSHSPVIDAILRTSGGGLLLVLNEYRQILAINDSSLRALGVEDPARVLGLRPGEALDCIHASELAGGCGTSPYCSTCGAAIAIVATLNENRGSEQDCALVLEAHGVRQDRFYHVIASPLPIDNRRLSLILLQDITEHQKRAALERIFFHDLRNTIFSLDGAVQLLDMPEPSESPNLPLTIRQLTHRLAQEVALQNLLCKCDQDTPSIHLSRVDLGDVIGELQTYFAPHPSARLKTLEVGSYSSTWSLNTDRSLLFRILTNMLVNAFEATEAGGTVKFWIDPSEQTYSFCVWNKAMIPFPVARRVFQRNFSTKEGPGRGLGTYSIKLLTEEFLSGKAGFVTSSTSGTTFRVTLPA
jgi:signal transduction histidine kinase